MYDVMIMYNTVLHRTGIVFVHTAQRIFQKCFKLKIPEFVQWFKKKIILIQIGKRK